MKSFLGYFPDDPPPPTPEPVEPTITDLVRGALRDRPGVYLTTQQITVLTGLSMAQVNGALSTLHKRGLVDRLLNGYRGRHSGQSYRWGGGSTRGGGVSPGNGKGGGG